MELRGWLGGSVMSFMIQLITMCVVIVVVMEVKYRMSRRNMEHSYNKVDSNRYRMEKGVFILKNPRKKEDMPWLHTREDG